VIVPRAIHELLRKHPDIAIRTREGPYDVLENALRNGSLDLITGATRRFAADSALRTEDLFEDELAVICGANHPLALRQRVTVREILDYDWILPSKSTPARRLFDRFLARRKVSGPVHVVETSSLSTTRGLLLESDRLALLSTHQVQLDEAAGLLVTLPIRLEETFRPIGVTTRANSTPSPAASAFIDALRRQTRMAEARRNGTPAGKHWP
jgi:DNA-binding transcriptional LysR family regulator